MQNPAQELLAIIDKAEPTFPVFAVCATGVRKCLHTGHRASVEEWLLQLLDEVTACDLSG